MIITGYEQLILYVADKTVQKPESNKPAFVILYFHYFLFLARKIGEMTQDWTQACYFPHCPIMFSLITGTLFQQCIMKTTSKVSRAYSSSSKTWQDLSTTPPLEPKIIIKKRKRKGNWKSNLLLHVFQNCCRTSIHLQQKAFFFLVRESIRFSMWQFFDSEDKKDQGQAQDLACNISWFKK